MTRKFRPFVALAAALILPLSLAGCADSTEPTPAATSPRATEASASAAASFPREVDLAGKSLRLEKRPEAIVVLSPSLTETVYGVGAGDQVKAVDSLSNYPADAAKSELSAFEPNVEAIAAMEPDLVVMSDDMNKSVAALEALKIPVALLPAPADVDGALKQFETVGELTGHEDEAKALAEKVDAQIEKASDGVKTEDMSYYWELGSELYTATSKTFIGSVLGEFDLTNIADEAKDASGGYPQLNAEFIIDADPDLIFLPGGDPAKVRKRAGWDVIRAVKDEEGIIEIDTDIASRWGPRIGDLAESVAAGVKKAS